MNERTRWSTGKKRDEQLTGNGKKVDELRKKVKKAICLTKDLFKGW